MKKNVINPWTWQEELSYVQAVEVKETEGTLYCAGQAAVHADGHPAMPICAPSLDWRYRTSKP